MSFPKATSLLLKHKLQRLPCYVEQAEILNHVCSPLHNGHDTDPTQFENMPLLICGCMCVRLESAPSFLCFNYVTLYVVHFPPSVRWSFMALGYM